MTCVNVPYNPLWPKIFRKEAKDIKKALKNNCLAIHHIGSTSVPNLSAKPKIDILIVVKDLNTIDNNSLIKLGFENRGEVIPTGRYFSKLHPYVHLHIFQKDNPQIERNLIFRDWLRTHPDDCKAYANLKNELSKIHTDGMAYCHAKTEFINKIIEKAKSYSST